MVDYICLLITLYEDGHISRVALKIKISDLPEDCVKYWAEPENKKALSKIVNNMPYSSGGCFIAEVQEISDITDLTYRQ